MNHWSSQPSCNHLPYKIVIRKQAKIAYCRPQIHQIWQPRTVRPKRLDTLFGCAKIQDSV